MPLKNLPPVAASALVISTDESQGFLPAAQAEIVTLRGAKAELEVDNRFHEHEVQKHERMLWTRGSEQPAPKGKKRHSLILWFQNIIG